MTRLYAITALLLLTTFLDGQQEKKQDDLYLMDLGIIIEPETQRIEDSLAAQAEVNMLVARGTAGAAYVTSAQELRLLLDDLTSKLSTLENSLDTDLESMRLENSRLRTLIRQLQDGRGSGAPQRTENEISILTAIKAEADHQPTSSPATFRQVLEAYLGGHYRQVIRYGRGLKTPDLPADQRHLVQYWQADAWFRLGQYEKALDFLAADTPAGHSLEDDHLVLRALVYMKMGQHELAREQFQDLITKYPDSKYRRLAEMTNRELHAL